MLTVSEDLTYPHQVADLHVLLRLKCLGRITYDVQLRI